MSIKCVTGRSISGNAGPHAFGVGQRARAQSLFELERFHMTVAKRVIKTVPMGLIQQEALAITIRQIGRTAGRPQVGLEKVPPAARRAIRSLRPATDTRPAVAGGPLAGSVFGQQDGAGAVPNHRGWLAGAGGSKPSGARCAAARTDPLGSWSASAWRRMGLAAPPFARRSVYRRPSRPAPLPRSPRAK